MPRSVIDFHRIPNLIFLDQMLNSAANFFTELIDNYSMSVYLLQMISKKQEKIVLSLFRQDKKLSKKTRLIRIIFLRPVPGISHFSCTGLCNL